MVRVNIQNQIKGLKLDTRRIRAAVRSSLALGQIDAGVVSVVIVDDPTIHILNRRHLEHDYPTDVLSFLLEQDGTEIEGDIICSADTAARMAPGFGWSADKELLLYVVHGALHLAGFDDLEPDLREKMRAAERYVLAEFGLQASYEERAGEG